MALLLEARFSAAVEGVDLVFQLKSGSSGKHRERVETRQSVFSRPFILSFYTFWVSWESFSSAGPCIVSAVLPWVGLCQYFRRAGGRQIERQSGLGMDALHIVSSDNPFERR